MDKEQYTTLLECLRLCDKLLEETERDKVKRKALSAWVQAVNSLGEYGTWRNAVSYDVKDVDGIIDKILKQ